MRVYHKINRILTFPSETEESFRNVRLAEAPVSILERVSSNSMYHALLSVSWCCPEVMSYSERPLTVREGRTSRRDGSERASGPVACVCTSAFFVRICAVQASLMGVSSLMTMRGNGRAGDCSVCAEQLHLLSRNQQ